MRENKTLTGDNRITVTEQAGTCIPKARDPDLGLILASCRQAVLPIPSVIPLGGSWVRPYELSMSLCTVMKKSKQILAVPSCKPE